MASTNPTSGPVSGGDNLPPQAYANAFLPLKPREATTLLQTRIHKARILTEELADYFAARRDLEATYLKALQKMAKRSFLSDPQALGVGFAPVYERLIAEIGETASVHGELEKKIAEECEMVMRNAPSRGEWARQKDHDDNLSGTLKELQLLESQLQKDQRKLETASSKKASSAQAKAGETQRSLDQTMQLWETEAPFTFEAYQRIDAQRLELLKETVTRFETIQSDAAQRLMGMTEQTLQAALTFDPRAEMQEFILKNGKGTGERRGTRGGAGAGAGAAAAAVGSGAGTPVRRPTTTMNNSSRALQRNDSVASSVRPSTAGAQRNGARGTGAAAGAEFGAGPSSASLHSTNDGQRTARGTSGGAASTLKSAFGRFGRGRSNKGNGGDNTADTSTVYGTLPGSEQLGGDGSRTMDRSMSRDTQDEDEDRLGTVRAAPGAAAAGGAAAGGLMAPMVPTRASTANTGAAAAAAPAPYASGPPQLTAPQVDSEGFSIPPPDRFSSGPASGMAEHREELADDTPSPTQRVGNMNIAPASSSPTTTSNTAQDQAALERVRSTLLTSGAPSRRGTTRRDRRDVRNTTYNPLATLDSGTGRMAGAGGAAAAGGAGAISQFGALAPQATGGSTASGTFAASPLSGSFSPALGGDRTQSLVSTSAGAGQPSQRPVNPFEAAPGTPGLRASITETVNAILTSNSSATGTGTGTPGIARLMVVGDIAVSLKDVGSSTSPPLHVRLECFEQLEKAAPNPAYLTGIASKPGEYMLDVAALARLQQQGGANGATAATATILKYQLHVSPTRLHEYIPVNVDARWRFEAHQTSFLCNWSLNASSKANARASGVTLTATVGPTGVSGVMAKPEGEWDAQGKRMVWHIGGEEGGEESGKILARFQVDGQGVAQPVMVGWSIPGRTMSELGVTVVGGGEEGGVGGEVLSSFDEVARRTVSGKYLAQ